MQPRYAHASKGCCPRSPSIAPGTEAWSLVTWGTGCTWNSGVATHWIGLMDLSDTDNGGAAAVIVGGIWPSRKGNKGTARRGRSL